MNKVYGVWKETYIPEGHSRYTLIGLYESGDSAEAKAKAMNEVETWPEVTFFTSLEWVNP